MALYDELKNKYGRIHVEFSDYGQKELDIKLKEFQKRIKEENNKIEDINEQIILTNPYYFDKIVGCLHNYAVEVSGDKVKNVYGKIALFTGWDDDVLNKKGDNEKWTTVKLYV